MSKEQVGCMALAEKYGLSYEEVETLYYLKEQGMDVQYEDLLRQLREKYGRPIKIETSCK